MTKKPPRDTATPDPAEPAPPSLPAGARFPRPSEPLGPPTPEQAATWRASNPKAWADMTAGHWARFLRERDSPGFNYWTDSAGMDALLAAGLLPEGWSIPRDFKTRVLSLHREPGFPEGPDWAPIHAWLGRYMDDDPKRRKKLFVPPGGEGAADPSLARLKTMVDKYVAENGTIRTGGEKGPTTNLARKWLEGFMLEIGTHWPGRHVEACLKVHGIGVTGRSIDNRRKKLIASKRRG